MEPENHLFEKEHHFPNRHFGFWLNQKKSFPNLNTAPTIHSWVGWWWEIFEVLCPNNTLPETNGSPLKIGRAPKGNMLVSGRVVGGLKTTSSGYQHLGGPKTWITCPTGGNFCDPWKSHYHPSPPRDSVESGFYCNLLWAFINLNLFPAKKQANHHLFTCCILDPEFPWVSPHRSYPSQLPPKWDNLKPKGTATIYYAYTKCLESFFSKFCNIVSRSPAKKNTKKEEFLKVKS